MGKMTYSGVGSSLQDAYVAAHHKLVAYRQENPAPGKDFLISKVITSGVQTGGFVGSTIFYVDLFEDDAGEFKS